MELNRCLVDNIDNRFIDKIYLLIDQFEDYDYKQHAKIEYITIGHRPTYADFFSSINEKTGWGDINIIANSDIYFDHTLEFVKNIRLDQCYALTVYNVKANLVREFMNRPDSQDVWIFKGFIAERKIKDCAFTLGKRGCDNAIADRIKNAGYHILNPSFTIKAIHVHLSNKRNYDTDLSNNDDIVPRPYLLLEPVALPVHPPKPIVADKKPVHGIESLPSIVKGKGEYKILHIALNTEIQAKKSLNQSLRDISSRYQEIDWVKIRDLHGIDYLQQYIVDVSNKFAPDITFMQIQREGIIFPSTAKQIKGFTINWTGDVRQPTPKWFIDIGKEISLTLFTNMHDVDYCRAQGIKADYLQVSFEHDLFMPGRFSHPVYPEIVFLGNNYDDKFPLSGQRSKMHNILSQRYGKKYRTFGHNWYKSQHLNLDQEVKCYNTCKIAINHSHYELSRYSSDRLFRIMGAGAFCLTNYFRDIEKEFEPGKHLETWKDFNELISKIDHYLVHEDKRKQISANGCKLVHEKYKWPDRIKELELLIKKYK
jgi:hypothetical protein